MSSTIRKLDDRVNCTVKEQIVLPTMADAKDFEINEGTQSRRLQASTTMTVLKTR